MRKLGIEPKTQSTEAGLLTTKVSQFPMQSEEKKEKKKEHAFFPFQTCSFANVFIRLNASTNTFITFYGPNKAFLLNHNVKDYPYTSHTKLQAFDL